MSSVLTSAPTHGLRRWYAVFAGIAWWMVHLMVGASLVRASCLHPSLRWALHANTVVCAAGTVVAIVWSVAAIRSARTASGGGPLRDPDGASGIDRELFLGLFGLAVGSVSLLLILWEGAYVVAFSSCTVA
jgi:hypothetical protein